jgi:hypothetical protein
MLETLHTPRVVDWSVSSKGNEPARLGQLMPECPETRCELHVWTLCFPHFVEMCGTLTKS